MANILFINQFVNPKHGGVERVSWAISEELKNRGHNLYFVHSYKDIIPPNTPYLKIESGLNCIEKFVIDNQITTIINQEAHSYLFSKIIKKLKQKFPNIKIISFLHNDPNFLWENIDIIKQNITSQSILEDFDIKRILKKIFFPFYSFALKRRFIKTYAITYINSDNLVLLSERYKKRFCQLANLKEDSKIVAIPNPLGMDNGPMKLEDKEKIVVIISRLSPVKRLDMAINAWNIALKGNSKLKEWKLNIYGEGECEGQLRKLISELNLTNVSLKGYTNQPLQVLKKASIFLMTSKYEGFGMTLTESLSQGVIPIVFNSFDAIKDIIISNENGILVKNSDMVAMADSINKLVNEDCLRRKMSNQAIISVKKFDMDNIMYEWEKYLK